MASTVTPPTRPFDHVSSVELALFSIHLLCGTSFLIHNLVIDSYFGYHLSYGDAGSQDLEGEVASLISPSVI